MKKWREWIPLLVLLGIALLLPLLPFSEPVHKRLVSVSGIVFLYMIFALGLNVVPGWTGLLDLGYVAFVAIGAYTFAILYRQPWMQWEGAWLVCLVAAALHAALWGTIRMSYVLFLAFGFACFWFLFTRTWMHFPGGTFLALVLSTSMTGAGVYLFRRVLTTHLIGDYYAIVTFAFAQVLLIFIQNATPVTNAARGYTDYPGVRVGGHATGVGVLPPGSSVDLAGEVLRFPVGARLIFPRSGETWAPQLGVPTEVAADVKVWEEGTLKWRNLTSGTKVTVPGPGYKYTPPGKLVDPSSRSFYYLLLFFVVACVVGMARLHDSRVGRAWLAMKADEISAKANGISIWKYRMLAFAVSGFVGGLGGALQALRIEIVTPGSYDFWVSVLILACIVLGGLGSIRGVIVGTAALVSLGEILREGIELSPGLSGFFQNNLRWLESIAWQAAGDQAMLKVPDQARYLVFGAILVLVMIFRPQGLLPPKGEREPFTEEEREKLRNSPTALFRMGNP
ncbi:MAG: branched-chain amino acid ABC transporter permease [Planctomycetota bacterium]